MANKHVQWDASATIAFGSITNTYANLLAMSDDADILFVENTTDQAILLSLPTGYDKVTRTVLYSDIRWPAGCARAVDFRPSSKRLAKGTIQVKYVVVPTQGEVCVTVLR